MLCRGRACCILHTAGPAGRKEMERGRSCQTNLNRHANDECPNIHQQLIDLLGEDHPVTQHFSRTIRHARETARMEAHQEGQALYQWLRDKLGGEEQGAAGDPDRHTV